jgi:hypothetical protein
MGAAKAFEEGPVFIICDTRLIVDRQHFRAIVFPAGVYKDSGSSLAAWTVFPDTFAAAEGLGAIPDAALQSIQDRFRNYPKIPRRTLSVNTSAASGTGTAVGDGTLVVTCAHVVNGRKAVSVLSSGKSYECDVLSEDKVLDIAVLKLKEGKLPAVTINSLGAETGETVFEDHPGEKGYPPCAARCRVLCVAVCLILFRPLRDASLLAASCSWWARCGCWCWLHG